MQSRWSVSVLLGHRGWRRKHAPVTAFSFAILLSLEGTERLEAPHRVPSDLFCNCRRGAGTGKRVCELHAAAQASCNALLNKNGGRMHSDTVADQLDRSPVAGC